MAKRQQLWCEAAQTATMLDNILVQKSAKSPPFTQFFGVDAKYAKHLRVFGEICVVADTDNKFGRTKIDPRDQIRLFVGYSTQHAGDVYRLLNPKTSRVQSIIGSTCSFFFFRKKLFLYFVASSTNITQCCLPPMLGFLIDEMSKYILSPGFLVLSSFFFGIFFCLIL